VSFGNLPWPTSVVCSGPPRPPGKRLDKSPTSILIEQGSRSKAHLACHDRSESENASAEKKEAWRFRRCGRRGKRSRESRNKVVSGNDRQETARKTASRNAASCDRCADGGAVITDQRGRRDAELEDAAGGVVEDPQDYGWGRPGISEGADGGIEEVLGAEIGDLEVAFDEEAGGGVEFDGAGHGAGLKVPILDGGIQVEGLKGICGGGSGEEKDRGEQEDVAHWIT